MQSRDCQQAQILTNRSISWSMAVQHHEFQKCDQQNSKSQKISQVQSRKSAYMPFRYRTEPWPDHDEHEHLCPEHSWIRVTRWRYSISWTKYTLGIARQLCVSTTSECFSKSALNKTHKQLHYTAQVTSIFVQVASTTEWQHNIAQEQDKALSFPFFCWLALHALNLTSFRQCIKVAEAACGKGLKILSRDMQGKAICCCWTCMHKKGAWYIDLYT